MSEYLIQKETLIAIADQARRLGNVSDKLSPTQIQSTLEGVTLTGGNNESLFESTASAILPTVYKGAASSEFIVGFETNAVGVLQEG